MIFLPFLDNLSIIGKLIVTYIWTFHDWISLIYIVINNLAYSRI